MTAVKKLLSKKKKYEDANIKIYFIKINLKIYNFIYLL
jgi:hypothetical protein